MTGGKITGLEVQKRNKQRVNVYIDEEYAFSLTMDEAAKLHKGQTLSDADIDALKGTDEVQKAMDTAARFLSFRPRSEHEIRRNLSEKDVPDPVIDTAIERLREQGFLDDQQFATFWVRQRNESKPISPRALRYELREKGIANALIDEALAEVDADDAAYRAAQAQLRKLRGNDKRTFRQKMNAFLNRRGFSFGDAKSAIERLIEELDEDDPKYFVDAAHTASDDWADS